MPLRENGSRAPRRSAIEGAACGLFRHPLSSQTAPVARRPSSTTTTSAAGRSRATSSATAKFRDRGPARRTAKEAAPSPVKSITEPDSSAWRPVSSVGRTGSDAAEAPGGKRRGRRTATAMIALFIARNSASLDRPAGGLFADESRCSWRRRAFDDRFRALRESTPAIVFASQGVVVGRRRRGSTARRRGPRGRATAGPISIVARAASVDSRNHSDADAGRLWHRGCRDSARPSRPPALGDKQVS